MKEHVLGVRAETLATVGAVSEQTVREMAEGVRRLLHTDYAIATSGVAGPTGGTPDKPVGTVWIAWATPEGTTAECCHFFGDRMQITNTAAMAAIGILKYCIPALIVLLATWIVMYKLFQNEQQKREWELKKAAQKEISPIRLRAYERLALVLERTQPEHLLMDLDVSQFTVPQLQQRLLQTIRLEFDHNMSQQIYVSEQVWDKIVAARGQMLAFVSAMAMQLPPESTSLDYAKTLLTAYNTNGETANETALHALKEEAAKLI